MGSSNVTTLLLQCGHMKPRCQEGHLNPAPKAVKTWYFCRESQVLDPEMPIAAVDMRRYVSIVLAQLAQDIS